MENSNNGISLSFDISWGRFCIVQDLETEPLFTLRLESEFHESLVLGNYSSICDAVSAVTHQETGIEQWDQLDPHDLPLDIFNIACWNFNDASGTMPKVACS